MNTPNLILKNLTRKPTRTMLTIASLGVAFVLFMLLQAVTTAFSSDSTGNGVQRIIVDSRYSMTDNLPISFRHQIAEIPGVHSVINMSWFGGFYQDPKQTFASTPTDPLAYLDVFPELVIDGQVKQRFQQDRRGVIVASSIAETYGWVAGDVIPMQGDIWPKADNSWNWEFILAGTYDIPPCARAQPWLVMHYDYFNDSVMDWVKDSVGWYVVRVTPGYESSAVIQAIDDKFATSTHPTKSISEDEYARQFTKSLGDITVIAGAILAAVFFTILLLSGNVAALAFAERTTDLAVMRTLGFSRTYIAMLVLAEGLLICLLGAATGLVAALMLEPALQSNLAGIVPGISLHGKDMLLSLAIAASLGLCITLFPGIRAYQLSLVYALRGA